MLEQDAGDDPNLVAACLDAAGRLKFDSLTPLVGTYLDEERPMEVRTAAFRALASGTVLPAGTGARLRAGLVEPNEAIRIQATRAARLLAPDDAVAALVDRLGDRSWWVRRAAAETLAQVPLARPGRTDECGRKPSGSLRTGHGGTGTARPQLPRLDGRKGGAGMSVWTDILHGFEIFILVYFAVLTLIYALSALLGLRSIVVYSRELSPIALKDLVEHNYYKPVSILVPAYNEQETIVANLTSLLRLRYPQFEVVVAVDGATDETVARMIDSFGLEPSPMIFRHSVETQPVTRILRPRSTRTCSSSRRRTAGGAMRSMRPSTSPAIRSSAWPMPTGSSVPRHWHGSPDSSSRMTRSSRWAGRCVR